MKNETISKDVSNVVVEIKQKFLEATNLTQDLYCTRLNWARIYKKDIF